MFDNGKLLVEYIESLHEDALSIPAIITDIEMPEMSGFTVVKILKDDSVTKHIPIIVNSSMTGSNNKREAEIMSEAGKEDAITLSTNMAGRGTDIKLSKTSYEK